jgi:hypothetical protein
LMVAWSRLELKSTHLYILSKQKLCMNFEAIDE